MDQLQENKRGLTFRTSKRLALLKEAFQEPGNDEKRRRCHAIPGLFYWSAR